MANLLVRRNANEVAPIVPTEWEPLRMMRELLGWDPFREMAPLMQVPERIGLYNPSFEIKETRDGYVFKADLPGVKDDDIQITLTGNRLTVAGKREEEKKEQTDSFYCYERAYGNFTRVFTLPEGADLEHIHTELKEGVLTIAVSKKAEVKPKKIDVKSASRVRV